MVFEKAYHGGTLSFSYTSPMTLPHQFTYGIFNDIECTRARLDLEVGVIIVEPMQFAGGLQVSSKEFLQFLRDEATRIGAVLIFDEVVTSRLCYRGMQEHFGITPDMTTLGKHYGGGFPFGAFGGRRAIMDLFTPGAPQSLYHSGTWNNNPFTMSAGVVATKLLSREALDRTNKLGDALREGLHAILGSGDSDVAVSVGFGSVVGLKFKGPEGDNWRDIFYFYMLNNHIYIGHRGFFALNITHTQEHVDRVLEVARNFCRDTGIASY